jgi:hypothetical protein
MLYLLCCPGTRHRECLAFYVRFLCVLRIPAGFAGLLGRICGTRPPGSPSKSPNIFPPHPITFSPTPRPAKSFRCNTYATTLYVLQTNDLRNP